MKLSVVLLGLCPCVIGVNHFAITHKKPTDEYGSYMNPNPRTPCEGEELAQLNVCANDVLTKLDDCKADDLACECCALQSLNRACYGLCSGSPSGSFLSVLYRDCESLNDVNACGLPFKKNDGVMPSKPAKYEKQKGIKSPDAIVKSHFGGIESGNSTEKESDSKDAKKKDEKKDEKKEELTKEDMRRGRREKAKDKLKEAVSRLESKGSRFCIEAGLIMMGLLVVAFAD